MGSVDPPLESEPTIVAPVSRNLSVANLGRSIAFYRDMLGNDVRPLNEGEGGGAVAEAVRGPARIQFTTQPGAFDSTGAARPRDSAMVFFQANDVAAMREFIVACGGTARELEKVNWINPAFLLVSRKTGTVQHELVKLFPNKSLGAEADNARLPNL
jgi:predicted enzyme related to lactoylglutathione lyase